MKRSHVQDESQNYRSKIWQKNMYLNDHDDDEFTDDELNSTDHHNKRILQKTPSASSQKTDDSADTPSSDKSRLINVPLLLHCCALSILFTSCNVL
jgi:hypothetical protein